MRHRSTAHTLHIMNHRKNTGEYASQQHNLPTPFSFRRMLYAQPHPSLLLVFLSCLAVAKASSNLMPSSAKVTDSTPCIDQQMFYCHP